ncbi:hypothetical protein EV2_015897 [Malus domestica]
MLRLNWKVIKKLEVLWDLYGSRIKIWRLSSLKMALQNFEIPLSLLGLQLTTTLFGRLMLNDQSATPNRKRAKGHLH